MVLQLNDKYLSDKARKAVNNINNKSQLLREAIEFYVNRDEILTYGNKSKEELISLLIKEISELKATIKGMTVQNVSNIGELTKQEKEIVISNVTGNNWKKENLIDIDKNTDLSCYED